ncbi:MAG: hypothetical protein IPP88_02895 [Betaproteobacteria bacterium]|nr:hypothetical protein [Betaproteobacteria bacterium]
MIVSDQSSDTSRRRKSDHRLTDGRNASAPPADTQKRPNCEQLAFDILISNEKLARGVEIELTGIAVEDVFHAFYLNRHGTPVISRTAQTIVVRFESLWRTGVQILSLTRQAHAAVTISRPYVWEIALLGGGGSERLCLEMSTHKVKATYRWLLESDETGDALVAETSPAFMYDARTGFI